MGRPPTMRNPMVAHVARREEPMNQHVTHTSTTPDRVEKRTVLRAPRERVWRALATAEELGAWFGADLHGEIAPGATVSGKITHPDFTLITMTLTVVAVDPGERLAWRWHPYAVDPDADYGDEPTTLVDIRLADAPGGTQLVITESGFEALPEGRRALAFRMNDGGWDIQLRNIAGHVEG